MHQLHKRTCDLSNVIHHPKLLRSIAYEMFGMRTPLVVLIVLFVAGSALWYLNDLSKRVWGERLPQNYELFAGFRWIPK